MIIILFKKKQNNCKKLDNNGEAFNFNNNKQVESSNLNFYNITSLV